MYATAKAGLIGMTRTLAVETGRHGITVNVVLPGPVETAHFTRGHPVGSVQRQTVVDMVLVGRLGTPDDVARAVAFLLDDDSGFITGQSLFVCGGTKCDRDRRSMISQSVRPLRAALLGTGAWAKVLAAAARGSTLIHIASVWGRTPERARALAATAGVEMCDSLEQVWANEDIEAVVIALPNAHHYPFAKLAASHGKHIFIEKPIAHTLEDGLRTAALERAYPIRIAVGHCARLLPGNRAIGDAIHRGELGPISLIEANFSRMIATFDSRPGDWRWYQAGAPGGPLSQIAIHQFDVLRALGGDLESGIQRNVRRALRSVRKLRTSGL